MSTGNAKPIVLSTVLAVLAGVGLVFCVAILPIALQGCREAKQREATAKSLKQLGDAMQRQKEPTPEPPAPAVVKETPLAFDVYSGYFVSNKFEPNAAESFAVIGDQAQFDKIFGVAMVMGDKSHRLPAGAFQSSIDLGGNQAGPRGLGIQRRERERKRGRGHAPLFHDHEEERHRRVRLAADRLDSEGEIRGGSVC